MRGPDHRHKCISQQSFHAGCVAADEIGDCDGFHFPVKSCCIGRLEQFVEALKTIVATARYFMSLSGTQKPECRSALEGKNEIFKLKKPQQPYTYLFFRLQFACYHCHFLERTGRCPLPVETSLSSLHETTHENSWVFVPNNHFEKPLHPLFNPVLLWAIGN